MANWYALGLGALVGTLAVACGGSGSGGNGGNKPKTDAGADASDASDASDGSNPIDSGSDAPVDSSAEGGDAEAMVCVSSCSTDVQCQSSCPATDAGIACCDTTSGVCFNSTAIACPVPQDSGVPPY